MKYRYIAELLVALSFNSGFAADVEITANDYQEIYEAFTRRSAADINTALKNNQDFNHKADGDSIRSSAAGLALRTAVIGLGVDDLKTVVEANHAFFKTSLGVSLLHGWALNQFQDAVTPCYIGTYFSFDKMLQGLAEGIADAQTRTFLKSAFTRGLAAVEADRWAYYDHMLYLPYAIGQVRQVTPAAAPLPSVDAVIADARRSSAEARAEAASLVPAKAGRTVHLDVVANPAAVDSLNCVDLFMVQKCILQRPELFNNPLAPAAAKITLNEQEMLLSLPAGTLDTYKLPKGTVAQYIAAAKQATRREAARVQATFFTTSRRATIQRILTELRNADAFVQEEAVKDAMVIIRNASFLEKDQDKNPASFPEYMETDDPTVGLDACLVQKLAVYARRKSPAFMSRDSRYTTVIDYAAGQTLKATFGNYRPERAPIAAVRDALRVHFPAV